jgi:beta-lactamase regulating signal transducer with metallopeptidase domain
MFPYIIKVTLIWSILLCLYEWLYKHNPAFLVNRIYLFVAIAAGLLLPLFSWHIPFMANNTPAVTAFNNGIQNIGAATEASPQQANTAGSATPVNWYGILLWVYLAGVLVFALMSIREIILILRTAIYGQYKTIDGHKIFSSKHSHAPFSFMGWIFISNPELYSATELSYILVHEDAHNNRKHWLDMILMQIVFVVLWFHPLVWRFRYLLKLTHEFEADRVAANDNTYEYGTFLLQQTLLKGTPVIAHSFHFSPIKNRITMLTNTRKNTTWKYALALPALLVCTMVFAKSVTSHQRVRVGDKTTFMEKTFLWSKSMTDSITIEDPKTHETRMMVMHSPQQIYMADRDSVFFAGTLAVPPQFRNNNRNFSEYLTEQFKQQIKDKLEQFSQIAINNVVVDRDGKIIYYDIMYMPRKPLPQGAPEPKGTPAIEDVIAKIIDESPQWSPGAINGKSVASYMEQGGQIKLNSFSLQYTK